MYGEHVTDGDVRLYLSKRERNKQRPHKRGDFPPDDSFDRPQTFLKLAPAFREVVCECPATALLAALLQRVLSQAGVLVLRVAAGATSYDPAVHTFSVLP
jgi:hypothetical protein